MKRALSTFETIAAAFLLAIALLTFGNVALREAMDRQIPDWFDLSKQLQAIAMFWGIALATLRGSHICVDVLWEHCREPGRRAIDIAATALTLAFLTKYYGEGSQDQSLADPLHTIPTVDRFGLVTVAPFTALASGWLFGGEHRG